MTDTPWQGDACSLVEAFRAGERSPVEELEATYAAIDVSTLNAFAYTAREQALAAARRADVSLPFGGVPIGVKELDDVEGWPATDACVVFEDRIATQTSINVQRLRDRGGAVLAGLTTASEFGGVNVTRTVLHGVTRNPWNTAKTPGGSSGGTASAVSGGLVTLGTGGDGGGSIRIPAGFTGLVGLKATYGRIPRGPRSTIGNFTVTVGCLSRSVRDTARWFDVANGYDARDQFSLPRTEGWERELGKHIESLRGLRVAVVPDWGGAVVAPGMWELLDAAADRLIASTGMVRVAGVDSSLPSMGAAWSISGGIGSYGQLAAFWPDCKDVLTPEIRGSVRVTKERYDLDARVKIEQRRMELNERMAAIFTEVDLVITASNPDVAFAAEGPLPSEFGGITAGAGNNGRLTFPANMHGNPAVSVPAGTLDGLPIGMQIIGRHYAEQQLLDAALVFERNEPWPLVAPLGATHK
ncbi:MAG: putative amidase [Acidimicrobiales bacterium]|nr:putative amidase [Acidimicrobiales bacterium]